jgi:GDP-mannose 4,6-dehydratase
VYNLAGQTSVGLSFEQPVETLESIAVGTLNILEAIRFIGEPIKFYNAASSEVFGDINGAAADESTPFSPRSLYAVAKATAFWEVANYREADGLFACSGILFNHDSPLRPERFVTMTQSREPNDRDLFTRLAQVEYRLSKMENTQEQLEDTMTPGGYITEAFVRVPEVITSGTLRDRLS